jgi:hypothetical protein
MSGVRKIPPWILKKGFFSWIGNNYIVPFKKSRTVP